MTATLLVFERPPVTALEADVGILTLLKASRAKGAVVGQPTAPPLLPSYARSSPNLPTTLNLGCSYRSRLTSTYAVCAPLHPITREGSGHRKGQRRGSKRKGAGRQLQRTPPNSQQRMLMVRTSSRNER